ncbi:MAG TPA: hypothetical protein VMR45_04290 [Patescibacteria group bacterium]|nr:hypothetical protein [Patescibacteria group bacterium]
MAKITPKKIKTTIILPSDVVEEIDQLIGDGKEFLDWADFLRVAAVKFIDDKKEASALSRHRKKMADNQGP